MNDIFHLDIFAVAVTTAAGYSKTEVQSALMTKFSEADAKSFLALAEELQVKSVENLIRLTKRSFNN